jgi:nitroreductase
MLPSAAPDVERWLAALRERRSRREYDSNPLSEAGLTALEATAEGFRPYEDARVAVIRDAPASLFFGVVGAYGRVSGAPSALAFIAADGEAHSHEHCGYTGEGVVLEASASGLATCWVGGAFSRSRVAGLVDLAPGESVLAVSPVGHALERIPVRERLVFRAGKPKHHRALEEIAPGWQEWPAWARAGVAAARIAPSAMNRQPWRFAIEDGAIRVWAAGTPTPKITLRLDCGIAMLHFEIAARAEGCDGAWEPLEGRDVARWVPAW